MGSFYHDKTALDCMVDSVPMVAPKTTIGEITTLLSKHASSYSSVAYIYLVNADRTLFGVVSVKDVFMHSSQTIAATIAKDKLISAFGTTPAEDVAILAIDNNLKAVPIVEEKSRRMVGVVTPDAIRDILHSGRLHDAFVRAGTAPFDDPKSSLLYGTPMLHVRKRLPWLLIGLLGGFLAALIVQKFEVALETHVLIIAFIPLVVYLADAVGSQTEIIFVRALALDSGLYNIRRFSAYASREFVVSLALAVILGVLMSGLITWWFAAPQLVLLIFTAIISTLMLSTFVALFIPYIATRLDADPALTSGPVATVIRDVSTLLVYFLIVSLFL